MANSEKVIIQKAKAFLEKLHPPQVDLTPGSYHALFPFDHANSEAFDYFAPSSQFTYGLTWGYLNPGQKEAMMELLEASLSEEGFKKVKQIRMLEYVLKMREIKNPLYMRDSNAYYFSFFGIPSEQGAWRWRVQGHHLSLQWTFLNGKIISSTPQFIGTQPALIKQDDIINKQSDWIEKYNILIEKNDPLFEELPLGTRVLKREEDVARELIENLSEEQLKSARVKVPWDLASTNVRNAFTERKTNRLEDTGAGIRGVLYVNLNERQQQILRDLVREYTIVQLPSVARERIDRIEKAGWDRVRFLFMNGYERGDELAYTIRSDTFIIEYNNAVFSLPNVPADHQHSVWRDITDFGDTYVLMG